MLANSYPIFSYLALPKSYAASHSAIWQWSCTAGLCFFWPSTEYIFDCFSVIELFKNVASRIQNVFLSVCSARWLWSVWKFQDRKFQTDENIWRHIFLSFVIFSFFLVQLGHWRKIRYMPKGSRCQKVKSKAFRDHDVALAVTEAKGDIDSLPISMPIS